VLRDAGTGEVLGELIDPEDRMVVARGGRGGRGNAQFATPTNRAPRRCEPGWEGEERILDLELKLIADVGLVGEPNAGKSTFLAAVSRATPKVADYPFTTLAPNLGVVEAGPERSFVVADIPGIIEGAHEGKGLGLQFLRHIERTRTLALMIPADALEPEATYQTLREELERHAPELARKPHCVVFTKADLLPPDWEEPRIDAPDAWGQFVVSSVAQRGIQPLLDGLWEMLSRGPERQADVAADGAWEP
jgi:GTPase